VDQSVLEAHGVGRNVKLGRAVVPPQLRHKPLNRRVVFFHRTILPGARAQRGYARGIRIWPRSALSCR
jgi:hypothetical protein